MYIPPVERWFKYESGDPWCESGFKYQTLYYVAEFSNSFTALAIIIFPLINLICLKDYVSQVNKWILVPHVLMFINGISSSYYHATTSFFGQIVDQLSLIWIIFACGIAYFPTMGWYPAKYRVYTPQIRMNLFCLNAMLTLFGFWTPSINDFVLMLSSIPIILILLSEARNSDNPEIADYTWKVVYLWAAAAGCWCADKFLCPIWLFLGTPYLHSVFHILSSYAAYYIFLMFSLLDIQRREHEHKFVAEVKYCPDETKQTWWAFPYIKLKMTQKV